MNTITIEAAADLYQGDPAFTVDVDGVQVGGPFYVNTAYASGDFEQFSLTGNFAISPDSQISINYINDASGSGGDRNLYIGSIGVDGRDFQGSVAALGGNGELWNAGALWTDGSLNFSMGELPPASQGGLSLLGVNLSGAEEYGALQPNSVLGVDYAYPTNAEIDYYASEGLNIIRLPIQWERLQPTENGPLSAPDLAQIDRVVAYANSKGMKVDLDPHNYGAYEGNPIGSAAVPVSAFTNLWSQLATHYASNSQVLFGLMNEPNLPAATWLDAANSAIQAIRAAGADSQKILVSGIDYDSTTNWLTSGNASVLGNGIVDPANNYAFEVHEYLDSDGSGVGSDTVSTSIGVDRMQAITEWARDTGHQLFLGEFGANTDPTATTALGNMLSYMQANSDVWLGGTYWEASTSYNYYFNIAPTNGVASAQMNVLDQYAPGTNTILPPVLSGVATTSAVTDQATDKPFSGIGISDTAPNAGDSAAITVTNAGSASDGNGVLAGAGLTKTGAGTYTLAAVSPATLAAELAALVFTPTAHQVTPGAAVTTGVQLTVADGSATATATTTTTATAVATAPAISGITATDALFDTTTTGPFLGVSVTDPDVGAATSAAITLSNGKATDANGILSGAGLTHTGAGTYSLAAASPAVLTSELRALIFTPTAHQGAAGTTTTTHVTLGVTEGHATSSASASIVTQATAPPSAVTQISIDLSEDAYLGDAKGTIAIDGATIGGVQTITASHALGQSERFTFTGNFGTGPQAVSVAFTNDAYGGSGALDRNLYVNDVTLNGQAAPNSAASLYSDESAKFTLTPPGGAIGPATTLSNPASISESVYPTPT